MRVGALICGVLGGLIGLFVGFFGSALSGLAGELGWANGAFYQIVSLALPIAAIVGGGISLSSNYIGGVLMAISAIGTLVLFGFHTLSILPIVLIGIGALLAFLSPAKETSVV